MIISSYVISGETFAHLSKAPEEARKFCHFVNGLGYTTHYTHHGSINVYIFNQNVLVSSTFIESNFLF